MSFLTKLYRILTLSATLKRAKLRISRIRVIRFLPKGIVTLPCECNSNVFHVKFHVVDVEASAVLSAQTCKDMPGSTCGNKFTSATQHSKVSD